MRIETPQKLLESAYDQLGYAEGPLFEGASDPNKLSKKDWIDKGEWLTLTKEVGAQKIFFVENNPVVVFAQSDTNEPEALRKLYNKIWCMSRPRLLFLAKPDEITVYDLANQPARTEQEWKKLKPLEVARTVNEVAKKLKTFRREQIETGRLFEAEYRFGDLRNRADKALINNLKEVRKDLIKKGLGGDNVKYAHALIGRSIFIRYLEDREILIPEDFYEIASDNKKWKELLENDAPRAGINLSEEDSLYSRVLSDKDFTFALFEKLAKDFNGDMFPNVKQEKQVITPDHLHLIQDLLFGDVGKQKKLFFYAYQFKIIPLELISSIYEEFYHPEANKEKSRKPTKKSSEGAYYTPPALVDFLVNQVLTPERLRTKPRIIDPACGSGIFLVEAFRRLVRHRRLELGKKPNFKNLQKILREQIAGIEINPEAARIAAFSLYLAMLHYLDPPSIREQIYKRGNHLPNLVFDEDDQKEKSYNILLACNAFDSDYIENNPVLINSFASNCADIVIGNPPWGSPKKKEGMDAHEANKIAKQWCERNEMPVGRNERAQLFIWKALDLLKSDGLAGLFVHINTFLMHHDNSEEFRREWLRKSNLQSVFNFSHVRNVFFKGAIAPFGGVIFKKGTGLNNNVIKYWSARHTKLIEEIQVVIVNKNDFKYLRGNQDLTDHRLWKAYWWGNHIDNAFIERLNRHERLYKLSPDGYHGRGFEVSDRKYPSDWLLNYKEMPTKEIQRYGPLDLDNLKEIPSKVHDRGVENTYFGMRILTKRGIKQKENANGQIVACFAEYDFAFRNSIYGIKIKNGKRWMYKCLLGILWSSLTKYYLLLTTYDFGVWHDEIRQKEELLMLPILFPREEPLKKRIVATVDSLRNYDPPVKSLHEPGGISEDKIKEKRSRLQYELDQEVFELYELSDAEIDLIRDMCEVTLPYYYSPDKSSAGKPVLARRLSEPCGTIKVLPKNADLSEYLKVFIHSWEAYLDKETEFEWKVYQPEQTDSMIAVVFSVQEKNKKNGEHRTDDISCWNDVLTELENSLTQTFHSSRIYLEGMARAVTDDFVMIIKRNEARLWTRSMAREDAEATLVQAMDKKSIRERIIK